MAQNPLVGTNWLLIEFAEGNVFTPVIPGTQVTLEFAERDLAGSGGCNDYTANYLLKLPEQISISNLSSTDKACSDPPGIMEQEERYFQNLQLVEKFSIPDGNPLVLSWNRGNSSLRFERA